MAKTESGPPDKKDVLPGYIDDVLNRRDEYEFPNFTAGQLARIISDDEKYDVIDDVHGETVRNWLNRMIEGEVTGEDGSLYDVRKFKLGRRTVVYGRSDDPKKVIADGGTRYPTIEDVMYVNFMVVSLLAMVGLVGGLYLFDSILFAGIGIGVGLIVGALVVPFIYAMALLADILTYLSTRALNYYRAGSGYQFGGKRRFGD